MEQEENKTALGGRFGAAQELRSPQNYVREDGHVLLDEIKKLLANAPTGAGLLGLAAQLGISIQLLRGREETFFVPEGGQVMLMVGPRTQKATAFLALLLAGGIREAQQNLGGFVRPNPYDSAPEDQFVMGAGKELDIINTLCIIIGEMEKSPYGSGFLEAMQKLGYFDIYEADKAGKSDEEKMTVLLKNIKKEV